MRRHYRYQIQGPNAKQVIEKLNGGPVPEIKFFNMGEITIAGRKVRALRHGMAGAPGLEVWGPYEEGEEIRGGHRRSRARVRPEAGGARAYATNTLESGWIPSPLPAVYTGEKMKAYREWLPADGYEGTGSIGGSFVSSDIEDYYLTPYELGYGPFVKFDHDFIGREALEKIADGRSASKVTFAWNADDVAKVVPVVVRARRRALQVHRHAEHQLRLVELRQGDRNGGKTVGLSMFAGYSYNERSMLSLGRRRSGRGDRRRADAGLGRGGRRHAEDDGRAAHADRNPGQGVAGALLAGRPGELRRGLAHQAAGLRPGGRTTAQRQPRAGATCVRMASITWAL